MLRCQCCRCGGRDDHVDVAPDQVLRETGQALEAILIMMIVYLTISLTVSLAMNIYNARKAWETGA